MHLCSALAWACVLRAAARITIHRPCKARDVRTLVKLIKLLNSL